MKALFILTTVLMLAGCSDLNGTAGLWGTTGVTDSGSHLGTTDIWGTKDINRK